MERFTIYLLLMTNTRHLVGFTMMVLQNMYGKLSTKHYLLIDIQINAVMFEGRMQQPSRLQDVDI